jgi:hypothetical protein
LAILRLDRWKLRQRNQDLTNSLDDLLLLRGGELGEVERVVRHFKLARAAELQFIVRLDRDRWQQRDCDQKKKP